MSVEGARATPGDSPLVLAFPHAATALPRHVEARLNARGQARADTDWRIDELFEGLLPSAARLSSAYHRYMIDPNLPAEEQTHFLGQPTLGLCPTADLDGEKIYQDGLEPDVQEIRALRLPHHRHYHETLEALLAETVARRGVAVLLDCHAMRSRVPNLFDGQLPHIVVHHCGGQSCGRAVSAAFEQVFQPGGGHRLAFDAPTKPGWAVRQYGDPAQKIHAVELTIALRAYMTEEPPWTIERGRAVGLRKKLGQLLQALDALARAGDL